MNINKKEELINKWNEHHQDLDTLVKAMVICQSIMTDQVKVDTVAKLLDNKKAIELMWEIEKSGEAINQILKQEGIVSLHCTPKSVLEQAKVMLRDVFQPSAPVPQTPTEKNSPGMKR